MFPAGGAKEKIKTSIQNSTHPNRWAAKAINFVNMFLKLFSDSCTYLLNILQNMILETMVFFSKVRFVAFRWVDPINLCKLQIIFSSKTMFSNQNDYTRSVL